MLLANDNFNQALNVVVDYFMKIMDYLFVINIPGTNIPMYVLWILGAIVNLMLIMLKAAPSGFNTFRSSTSGAAKAFGRGLKNHSKLNAQRVVHEGRVVSKEG